MTKTLLLLAAVGLMLPSGLKASDAPKPWGALPSAGQMYYYKQEIGGLVHYGPNTYSGRDGIEWGDSGRITPDTLYLPATLNTDQWVQAAQAAGIRRLLMVAKHHDGFRLWKTQVNGGEYSIAKMSPERNPKNIDLLEEVSKSCTRFGMDMGLYLSPWDVYEDKSRAMQGVGEGSYGLHPERYPNDPYNVMYKAHLKEIFGRADRKYGRDGNFVEFWMDGAKNARKHQNYDFRGWLDIVEAATGKNPDGTPNAALKAVNFQGSHWQSVSWPGNERGEISPSLWSKLTLPPQDGSASSVKHSFPDGKHWTVWEGDYSIRPGWFYHSAQDGQVKQPAELFNRYLSSVGQGGVMLLGLVPDRRGLFHDNDVAALKGFGALLRETFGADAAGNVTDTKNLLRAAGVRVTASVPLRAGNRAYAASQTIDPIETGYDTYWAPADGVRSASLTVDLGGMKRFDLIRIQEYIPLGQRINHYRAEVHTANGWQRFGGGTVIGYQRLLRGTVTEADRIRITVSSDYAVPVLNHLGVYKLPEAIERHDTRIPAGLRAVNDSAFGGSASSADPARPTDAWYLMRPGIESVRDLIGGDNTRLRGNAYKEVTFVGSKFWIRGLKETERRWAADLKVSVDGGTPVRVPMTPKLSDDPRHPYPGDNRGMILYTSADLPFGTHTVRMGSCSGNHAVTLDALLYCPVPCLFEFADTQPAQVTEGGSVTVSVRRLGDAAKAAQVLVMPYPGTAVHGEDFTQEGRTVTFAPGETVKPVTFGTLDNHKMEGTQFFTLRLEPADRQVPASFNMEKRIYIRDNDTPAR